MKFSKLVETVSKKPIPPHAKHLVVEVMVMDEEGEDVEVTLQGSLIPFSRTNHFCRSLSSWWEFNVLNSSRRVSQIVRL